MRLSQQLLATETGNGTKVVIGICDMTLQICGGDKGLLGRIVLLMLRHWLIVAHGSSAKHHFRLSDTMIAGQPYRLDNALRMPTAKNLSQRQSRRRYPP